MLTLYCIIQPGLDIQLYSWNCKTSCVGFFVLFISLSFYWSISKPLRREGTAAKATVMLGIQKDIQIDGNITLFLQKQDFTRVSDYYVCEWQQLSASTPWHCIILYNKSKDTAAWCWSLRILMNRVQSLKIVVWWKLCRVFKWNANEDRWVIRGYIQNNITEQKITLWAHMQRWNIQYHKLHATSTNIKNKEKLLQKSWNVTYEHMGKWYIQ